MALNERECDFILWPLGSISMPSLPSRAQAGHTQAAHAKGNRAAHESWATWEQCHTAEK